MPGADGALAGPPAGGGTGIAGAPDTTQYGGDLWLWRAGAQGGAAAGGRLRRCAAPATPTRVRDRTRTAALAAGGGVAAGRWKRVAGENLGQRRERERSLPHGASGILRLL